MKWKCIDISQFTYAEIEAFCEVKDINRDNLFIAKEKGLRKVYYLEDEEIGGLKWMGYTTEKDPEIRLFLKFKKFLNFLEVEEPEMILGKVSCVKQNDLDLDTVLDKISAQGISSLSKEEINFLNSYSQSK